MDILWAFYVTLLGNLSLHTEHNNGFNDERTSGISFCPSAHQTVIPASMHTSHMQSLISFSLLQLQKLFKFKWEGSKDFKWEVQELDIG